MARIVQKYGGTSVRDLARIRLVAERVAAEAALGNEVAVVVSAMAGETNRLVDLTASFRQASRSAAGYWPSPCNSWGSRRGPGSAGKSP